MNKDLKTIQNCRFWLGLLRVMSFFVTGILLLIGVSVSAMILLNGNNLQGLNPVSWEETTIRWAFRSGFVALIFSVFLHLGHRGLTAIEALFEELLSK